MPERKQRQPHSPLAMFAAASKRIESPAPPRRQESHCIIGPFWSFIIWYSGVAGGCKALTILWVKPDCLASNRFSQNGTKAREGNTPLLTPR